MSVCLTPRSAVPGLEWPAVPAELPARLLSLQQQFAQSERWSPERLARQQFRQLTRLVLHAYDQSPFHRARLEGCGYRRGQEVTPELWQRLPLLSRRDVQEHAPLLACRDVPAEHGGTMSGGTSGSTGTPLRVLSTELAQLFWQAITLRQQFWHRRDLRLKFASIRREHEDRAFPPDGLAFPNWTVPEGLVYPTGPGVLLDNRSTPAEQAEWLLREEPDYLLTFPSVAQELARYCLEHGLKLKRLKDISTLGEVVMPRVRTICRQAFGVEISDMYSAVEIGYIALECPARRYHVQSEAVLLEVLDDAGRPCEPGEFGAVVVTPLHNFAMPLLRYSIGDFAAVGDACACGRRLPVLTEILGRARDTVMLPSGTRRYAWFGMRRFAEIPGIVQYQVVQKTLYDLEVKLVTREPLGPESEEKIRENLRKSLGEHFSVLLTYHETIPRTASGKYFDFLSEVPG
jgi:phenylacetate-coenzyme A ligase PaaK-like adenylate-forming protein